MISSKWSRLAESVLGDKEGKHCHWCKFIDTDTYEGEAHCQNEHSQYCDGDRIRTWDGLECADKCGFFELDEWYTDDKNYDEYFKDAK